MSVKPLTPSEVAAEQVTTIPDFVIEAVNGLLLAGFRGGRAKLYQPQLVDAIIQKAPDGTLRSDVFANHWLDFEDTFRQAGWVVVFDKPGYNESYDPNFTFTRALSRR